MKKIETMLGPIDSESLGKTLIHEHFLLAHPGCEGDQTIAKFDRKACVQKGVEMARQVSEYGVKTVVDATTSEYGRNPEILREISEKSGLNIICSAGFYKEAGGGSRYFKTLSMFTDGVSLVYELFKKEINDGIRDTGIKPGIFKLVTGKGEITDYEQMFFKAAARVSKEDGIPIFTHTDEGTMGPQQADLLISEGAEPKRILIGHSCGSTDIAYLTSMLQKGVYIGFDRFGLEGIFGTPRDDQREIALIGLIKTGYVNQIMISHDWINYWNARPMVSDTVSKLLPKWKPTHIFEDILPVLRKAGITEEQITTMLVDNPRRFFEGV